MGEKKNGCCTRRHNHETIEGSALRLSYSSSHQRHKSEEGGLGADMQFDGGIEVVYLLLIYKNDIAAAAEGGDGYIVLVLPVQGMMGLRTISIEPAFSVGRLDKAIERPR